MIRGMLLWLGLLLSVGAWAQTDSGGYRLVGMKVLRVPVTVYKMTNLVFPVGISPVVKVSRDILMARPKGVENVLELKAVRPNFPETNVSVYGRDGRLYSFVLFYTADTGVLNFRV